MPQDKEYQAIEEKIQKGETLNADEIKAVMSEPTDEPAFPVGDQPDADILKDLGIEDPGKPDASAEKKTEEKKPDASAEKKTEEAKNEGPVQDDALDKIMREIDKPEGMHDLTGFSNKEKGLFYELKKTRQRARAAEEELDVFRFNQAKEKKAAEKVIEVPEKNPDDFVTFADLQKVAKQPAEKKNEVDYSVENPIMRNYYNMCEEKAKSQFTDYDEVIECAEELVQRKPENAKKVAFALAAGKNPAVAMYEAIKADPEFNMVLPVAQSRLKAKTKPKEETKPKQEDTNSKAKEVAEAEKKATENANKPKTSAHHSGSDNTDGMISEEQFLKMDVNDFRAFNKKKRDAILAKYGV